MQAHVTCDCEREGGRGEFRSACISNTQEYKEVREDCCRSTETRQEGEGIEEIAAQIVSVDVESHQSKRSYIAAIDMGFQARFCLGDVYSRDDTAALDSAISYSEFAHPRSNAV